LWTATCPISGNSLSPACCWPVCLSSLCLLEVHTEISSLPLPPSPVHLQHTAPCGACSFSVPCLLFSYLFVCFLQGGRSVCPGDYAGLSQGWLWEYHMTLSAHLLVCQISPMPVSGDVRVLLFLCNMVWRSLIHAGGSGCQS
jgi:hypothetical protein